MDLTDAQLDDLIGALTTERDRRAAPPPWVFVDDMGFEVDHKTSRRVRLAYMAPGNPNNVISKRDRASLDLALEGLNPIISFGTEVGIAEAALFAGEDPRAAVEKHRNS